MIPKNKYFMRYFILQLAMHMSNRNVIGRWDRKNGLKIINFTFVYLFKVYLLHLCVCVYVLINI